MDAILISLCSTVLPPLRLEQERKKQIEEEERIRKEKEEEARRKVLSLYIYRDGIDL